MKLWPFGKKERPAPITKSGTISLDELASRMAAMNRVASGARVTPENAMQCTTVHGIVRALTNAIGSYPAYVGRSKTGPHGTYVERDPKHNLNNLLRKPNAIQTGTQFSRMMMQHTALYGNWYAIKGQAQTGPITYLRPIEDPDIVSLYDMNESMTNAWARGPIYKVSGLMDEPIDSRRMVHVTSGIVDDNGIMGKSPVRLAKEAIGICLAAEQFIAELYGNNALPTMLLTGGEFSSEEQYNLWVKKWREAYGNGFDRGGTALLPAGMEAQEITFKPIDAQVLEMRKFQRIEIAQVYGVPPHKLADLERATFSNIEEQSLEFVRDVAKPWVRLIEEALMRDLLTANDLRAGYVIRFDMEAATEGKLKERLEAYGKAYEIGAMNPNEIRQRLMLDPREDEGGEAYATMLNMRTTDDDVSDDSEGEGSGGEDEGSEPDAEPSTVRSLR